MRRLTRWRLSLRAKAFGNARIYQAQTQNIYFGEQSTHTAAAVVVERVVADQAAARSLFVGRRAQVDQLLGLLDPAGTGPATAVVSAIGGLGGVGKTALARHVVQAAVGRRWFPGGAVWVDLHGYAPDLGDRVAPGQVFGPLLRALGVPVEQVPPQPGEHAAAYHHRLGLLARTGRPVLLVLDNASTANQVSGLLPRHSTHRVVVTSRHTLGELDGVRIVDLDVLDTGEAVELVDQALRERDPADQRAVADPGGVAGLVGVCSRLPLALRIAAALLADDPAMTVSGLVDELADATTRLDTLTYEDRAVAAAFDLSWRHLTGRDPAAARLFRLLPVNPGPDLSTEAAAVVADLPVARVRPLLRVLRRAHLIQPTGPERSAMHDLVAAYATLLPEEQPGDRAAATDRLLGYYTTAAEEANGHLRALPGQAVPDRFTGRGHALAWLDTERANLVAAADLALSTGRHDTGVRLALALTGFFDQRRHLDDWVTLATAARHAADHITNSLNRSTAWNNLGIALTEVRRFDEAITVHEGSLRICQQAGDRHAEGTAWNNLGLALVEVRRFDEAITAQQTARDTFQQTGDRHAEGMAWGNLGSVLREVRRFDEAITAQQTARDIFQQTGDQRREGMAWGNIGLVLMEVGRFFEAATAHQRDLKVCQETGDRHGEGTAWNNLGLALTKVRRFNEAITAHQTARDLFQQTGDRHGESRAWNSLGSALREVWRFDEAITAHQTARDLFQQTGDRQGEGQAWNNLGLALREVRRFDEAITAFRHDLEICQQIKDRHGEGQTWNNLGSTLAQVRRFDEAITAHQTARDLFQQVGDRHGESRAWNNLGLALREVRRFDEAITAHQTARDLFQQVGDRHGEGTAGSNLGLALAEVRRFDEAITAAEQAVASLTEIGVFEDANRARRYLHTIKKASRRPQSGGEPGMS